MATQFRLTHLKAIFKVKWAQIDGPVFFVFAKFVLRYINMFVTDIHKNKLFNFIFRKWTVRLVVLSSSKNCKVDLPSLGTKRGQIKVHVHSNHKYTAQNHCRKKVPHISFPKIHR